MTAIRKFLTAGAVAVAVGAAAFGALAQGGKPMGGMGGGMGGGMNMDHGNPAMNEYMGAMDRMQGGMRMQTSGDADVDFVRMMIPHHQAAVEMAQTVLKYGKDPEIRKLAQDIVAAQNREIAQMKAWLALHAKQ